MFVFIYLLNRIVFVLIFHSRDIWELIPILYCIMYVLALYVRLAISLIHIESNALSI